MTLSARMETLISIAETGVLPLFYSEDADRASRITEALREGGRRPPHRPRRSRARRRIIRRSRQGVPLVTQAIAARDYQNLIDGRWVDAADGRTSERMSPAHDVVVGRYPAGGCRRRRQGGRGRPQGLR